MSERAMKKTRRYLGGPMICYRDMTFCPFYTDCVRAKDCARPLTPEVIAAANKWWEGIDSEVPIAVFVDKPGCHTPIENQACD